MSGWHCVKWAQGGCDEGGTGTHEQVIRAVNKHMRETGHATNMWAGDWDQGETA